MHNSRGPGNVVLIELESESLTEVFTGFGQINVPAEAVAMRVLDEARDYLAAGVPVGKHLADQLLLPLGIGAHLGTGGGTFRTMALSLHATTHIEILHRFLDLDAKIEQNGRDDVFGKNWVVDLASNYARPAQLPSAPRVQRIGRIDSATIIGHGKIGHWESVITGQRWKNAAIQEPY